MENYKSMMQKRKSKRSFGGRKKIEPLRLCLRTCDSVEEKKCTLRNSRLRNQFGNAVQEEYRNTIAIIPFTVGRIQRTFFIFQGQRFSKCLKRGPYAPSFRNSNVFRA